MEGSPFFMRLTCMRPFFRSICSHCKSQSSPTRRACLYIIVITSQSRNPCRPELLAAILSCFISAGVKYSRGRASALRTLVGGILLRRGLLAPSEEVFLAALAFGLL